MCKQNRQSGIQNFSFVAIVLFCLRANLDQNFLETINNLLTFIVSDFCEIRFVLQKQSLKHRKQLKELFQKVNQLKELKSRHNFLIYQFGLLGVFGFVMVLGCG